VGAWRVTADLLANSRFVVSPLAETVAAMTVLDAPSGPSQAAFRGANRAAYDEMLAAHPTQIGPRMVLASTILAQGRVREAAAQMRQAAAMLPDDVELLVRVAQGLSRLGETKAARGCMAHPIVATTRSGPALTALAHVCQGLGLNAEALQLMDRARVTGYDNPDFRYFRALQLQFNGLMEEAEEEMERCLRMGPTFGRASLSLARIRRQTPESNHVGFIRSRLASHPRRSGAARTARRTASSHRSRPPP